MNPTIQAVSLKADGGSLQGILGYAKKEFDLNASAQEFASYYKSDDPDFIKFETDFSEKTTNQFLKKFNGRSFEQLSLEEKSSVIQEMFFASRTKRDKTRIEQFEKYQAVKKKYNQLLKSKKKKDSQEIKRLEKFLKDNQDKEKLSLQGGKEFTFTIDKSLSVAVAKLPKEQQNIFYKYMMQAGDYGLDVIKHHIKENKKAPTFKKAKTASLRSLHLTNRDRVANTHYHCVFFNMQETKDGLKSIDIPMHGDSFRQLLNVSSSAFNAKLLKLITEDPTLSQSLKVQAQDSESKKSEYLSTTAKIAAIYESGEEKIKELQSKAFDNFIKTEKNRIEEFYKTEFEKASKIDDWQERSVAISAVAANKFNELAKLKSTDYIRKVKNALKPKKEEPGYSPEFLQALNEVSFNNSGPDFQFKPIDLNNEHIFNKVIEDTCKINNQNILSFSDFLQISFQQSLEEDFQAQREFASNLISKNQSKFIEVKNAEEVSYYVPRNVLEKNQETKQIFKNLANSTTVFDQIDVSFIPENIKFNQKQQEALSHGLSNDKLTLIRGVAGSGKSFVSTFIVDGHSRNTDTNYILAPTNKAIAELKEAFEQGVKAGHISQETLKKTVFMTVNTFNLTQPKLTNKSLVLMDEAGMVSDSLYSDLAAQISKAGCKTVLVGDQHQLQSVAPGSMFKSLMSDQDLENSKVLMTDIQRQRSGSDEHQLASLISGANISEKEYEVKIKSNSLVEEAFDFMKNKNFISVGQNQKQALVAQYLLDQTNLQKKLIIAATNKDVQEFNKTIQSAIQVNNQNFCSVGDDKYYVGDKVIFTEKVKDDHHLINNGDSAIIQSIDKNKMTLLFSNGETKEIDYTKDGEKLSLGYAITVHKSQGMTVDECYTYLSPSRVNSYQNLYVSLTRSKKKTKVFAEEDELSEIKESYKARNEAVDLYQQAQDIFEQENKQQPEVVLAQNQQINQNAINNLFGVKAPKIQPQVQDQPIQVQPEVKDSTKEMIKRILDFCNNNLNFNNHARFDTSKIDTREKLQEAFRYAIKDKDIRDEFRTKLNSIIKISKDLFGEFLAPDQISKDKLLPGANLSKLTNLRFAYFDMNEIIKIKNIDQIKDNISSMKPAKEKTKSQEQWRSM